MRITWPLICTFIFPMVMFTGCSHDNNSEGSMWVFNTSSKIQDENWWKPLSKSMVEKQIKARNISDPRLLKAMEETPRHLFVPKKLEQRAYADKALPIEKGQTISQPYIVALMTSSLQLQGDEKVLEIGTGSGYQAAILAQLAGSVFSIEIVKSLAANAKALLKHLEYNNVNVMHGDGYQGWPEEAPFDAIIITAAPPEIPKKLIEQLKPGGKMVLPVGRTMQELKLITKTAEGKVKIRTIADVRFVPMVHPRDTL